MLEGIFKSAKANDTTTVLMAGDIFESKNIRWNEQQAFMEFLFANDAGGLTTVLCNGNHDELMTGVSHMWLPSLINDFGGLSNTTIVDGEARLVKLPDMHVGVIPVVHNNLSTKELSSAVAKLYERADDELPFVMMLHATITGCIAETGMSLTGGPRIPKDCDFVDYWALGDIHKSQQMADKAWYSGAPIQHDFGDSQPKGVLVVTVEKGEEPQVELVELEGIKPLVTLTEVPDEWPTDCHIRYLGPLEGIIDLPENVIKCEGVFPDEEEDEEESQPVHVQFGDSLTEGLPEFLHAKGVTVESQEAGVKWVQEKYVK
jgi:DNA repair exonuclease SbcCD nuclease subunit